MSSRQLAYAQNRRSTRIDQAMPLAIQGVGAFREPFCEQVSTLSISCHGCTYRSKYEVVQGEVVYLEVRPPDVPSQGSRRARVKWVQKLGTKDRAFYIAVELEVAGNVWGIASPPADWFPVQAPNVNDSAASGRELRVVPQAGQPLAPQPSVESGGISRLEANELVASPLSPLTQLVTGLGEQIQSMASKAAAAALVNEKSRLLEEIRLQLREEATKAIQTVISNSKEDLTRRALKELNEAHEAGARTTYVRWMKKIEQDMASARQQAEEVSQRLDQMAVRTIERVQCTMEATRSEAVDRFVSRLRDQVAPLLEESKSALQALAASEMTCKKASKEIYAGFENRLASTADASLAKAQDALDKDSAAVAAKTNAILLKLSEHFEEVARENVQSLLLSVGNHTTKILEERTAEISREFSARLEGYTRNYLEFVAKSIAEIPRNTPGHPHD